ncbi:MAG: CPBP family intramembrane metalloprotease [Lachnospiraceae bacterium]|nr:CPBP family intramembrane metalloprotease [Lachnospiraceae bacterium]
MSEEKSKGKQSAVSVSDYILRDMANGAIVVGSKGKVLQMNEAAKKILEIGDDQTQSFLSGIDDGDESNAAFYDCIFDAIYDKNITNHKKVPYTSPSGKKYSLHMTSSFFQLEENEEEKGIVITFADETKEDMLILKRNDSMTVLVGAVFVVCLWVFTIALYRFLKDPFPTQYLSRLCEFLSCCMLGIFLKFTSFTVADMGLKSKHLKKDLKEAAIVAVCLLLFMIILKVVFIKLGSGYFAKETAFWKYDDRPAYLIEYIFIALFQEFLARCCMQENLHRILDSYKHGDVVAIAVSSLIFGVFHLHYGLFYMIGAAVLMGSLGIIYKHQRSIWGTYIVHYIFGIAGQCLHWI